MIYFPWFERKDVRDTWNIRKDKDFYEQELRSIYGVLDNLWAQYIRKNKRFYKNSLILYISLVLSFSSILIYLNLNHILLLLIPVAILSWSIVQKNWSKEVIKNRTEEVEKFFDAWKKEVEKNKKK